MCILDIMNRYNIHLKDSQVAKLKKIAEQQEEPVSRIIRDAIDKYLKQWE